MLCGSQQNRTRNCGIVTCSNLMFVFTVHFNYAKLFMLAPFSMLTYCGIFICLESTIGAETIILCMRLLGEYMDRFHKFIVPNHIMSKINCSPNANKICRIHITRHVQHKVNQRGENNYIRDMKARSRFRPTSFRLTLNNFMANKTCIQNYISISHIFTDIYEIH